LKGSPLKLYKKLYRCFGPQHWWPAKNAFEVMVGAILTQNTAWANVEKAIANLKKAKALEARKLNALSSKRLARLIRPAGYYNIKAARLKCYLRFVLDIYGGSVRRMSIVPEVTLRRQLLSVKGIGPETADSILLYALNKPVFVVDAYTKRIFSRHGYFDEGAGYEEVQGFFTRKLKKDVKLFNEYHALIVELGKSFCRKNKPRCSECPLKDDK